MTLPREIVGQFIDATVNDHAAAERLLAKYPGLRTATWLGDECVLNFLVIERFLAGIEFCLKHGFDANFRDDDCGTTPLHYACVLNYPEIAEALLDAGADVSAACGALGAPLATAVQSGNAALVDLLLTHGADPNYESVFGESVFDAWPVGAETELATVLEKHQVRR
ncbi:Ankyrin repeats (3 copies) [Posidoniimonas polymericola]|uniref:Ankyrin repeats (3 copies) n=1 Tax=Posidoniimonas polymericola TaxID=2528002 RepID=A0A5C5YTI3_9BACT|nr:ankyrin repeat domain-containing protein [Posidoniimonas polymericola]TWT78268.1 Ankyrin repeats (3 copies) [Posidoniimonas polymericola]